MWEVKHKIRRWRILLILAVTAVLFMISIVPNAGREKHIILILKNVDNANSFWSSIVGGAQMAARENGIKLTVMGPESETEYEEQGKMIEQAVEMKPDAIALVPSSYTETQKYAANIEKEGICLLLLDSFMEQEMGSCLVSTDNFQAGKKMGEYVAENFGEDIHIGIIGHVKNSSTAREREQGVREGLGKLSEKIEDVVFCDSDYNKSYRVTTELLNSHPDIDVLIGLNEYSTVGAAKAVKDMEKTGQVRMIGFDSSIREVRQLEGGLLEALIVQKPLNMGYLCIEKAAKLLDGEEIPEYVDSGSVLITKKTMYTEENQKLLFPF